MIFSIMFLLVTVTWLFVCWSSWGCEAIPQKVQIGISATVLVLTLVQLFL